LAGYFIHAAIIYFAPFISLLLSPAAFDCRFSAIDSRQAFAITFSATPFFAISLRRRHAIADYFASPFDYAIFADYAFSHIRFDIITLLSLHYFRHYSWPRHCRQLRR